jgi:hypothetical protein
MARVIAPASNITIEEWVESELSRVFDVSELEQGVLKAKHPLPHSRSWRQYDDSAELFVSRLNLGCFF